MGLTFFLVARGHLDDARCQWHRVFAVSCGHESHQELLHRHLYVVYVRLKEIQHAQTLYQCTLVP